MSKKEELVSIGGNLNKFKKDLEKELKKKSYKDSHELHDALIKTARKMIPLYLHFDSVENPDHE